jgi:hypothetical protein
MKYVKMLGLLAVAAGAFMAFAGSASATQITCTNPPGTPSICTPTLIAETEAFEGKPHARLTGPLNLKVECESKVEGTVQSHGAGVTAKGKINSLSFFNCTNGYAVTVLPTASVTEPLGSLEVHSLGGGNGTLTSSGTTVTVHTPLGFNCGYTTGATDIGTATGTTATGGTPTLDIRNALIPRTEHSGLCGATGTWNGNYIVTNHHWLNID